MGRPTWSQGVKDYAYSSAGNLFFIFIVEQDTETRVNLKNINMMTDKSKCSQLQVIFQSLYRQSCPPYLHCVLKIDGLVWFGPEGKPTGLGNKGSRVRPTGSQGAKG